MKNKNLYLITPHKILIEKFETILNVTPIIWKIYPQIETPNK
jgi:hypothetical protein